MENYYGLIEVVLVFGGVLLFAWWQLRSLRRIEDARTKQPERKYDPGDDAES